MGGSISLCNPNRKRSELQKWVEAQRGLDISLNHSPYLILPTSPIFFPGTAKSKRKSGCLGFSYLDSLGIMVACFSCAPDHSFLRINPFLSSTAKFGSEEAIVLLQKCTSFKQLKQIHARVIRYGISRDQLLFRKLLDRYSSYGKLEYSSRVFHQIRHPETFTWNFMIRTYTLNDKSEQALMLYYRMVCQGFPPDKFTFPFVIKACIASFALEKGKQVHGQAVKAGFARDMFVQNTLMDLYFKCGHVDCGRRVFEKMRVRSVVSWTTMITGLVECGQLDAARDVFDQMPGKTVVSWTSMINGYVINQQHAEAFELFWRMQRDNVQPNEYTLVTLLKACTKLESLKLGRWIHDFALKNGFKLGAFLGTALVDMYSKCGSLEDARRVFDETESKTPATWNSMICSLGVHGYGDEALDLFRDMEAAKTRPDAITYVGVLRACVNTQNVEKGTSYFKYMTEHYGIKPILEHYTCMIELYDQAKNIDKIREIVNAMPMEINNSIATAMIKEGNISPEGSIDKFLYNDAGELYCFRINGAGYPSYCQMQCFKWDVG